MNWLRTSIPLNSSPSLTMEELRGSLSKTDTPMVPRGFSQDTASVSVTGDSFTGPDFTFFPPTNLEANGIIPRINADGVIQVLKHFPSCHLSLSSFYDFYSPATQSSGQSNP